MFQITIRDWFWIMFIVGYSLWTLNYRQQIRRAYLERKTEEIAKREAAERRCVLVEMQYGVADERAKRLADRIGVLCDVIHTLQLERELWRNGETPVSAPSP
jgi:hypothetical protein